MTDATNVVTLPDKLCQTINMSMMTGMPVLVTYWDAKSEPNTSWRGSTHVHSDGRLAMWIRSPQGGLQKAIQTNPKLRLAYRNPHTKSFVIFDGEGRLETSGEGKRAIYLASPPPDQAMDPQMLGSGLVVTVTSVKGVLKGEEIALAA